MSIVKKLVEVTPDKKVVGIRADLDQSRRLHAMLRTPWPWPRAVMGIFLVSLLLWGGIVAIASVAFD